MLHIQIWINIAINLELLKLIHQVLPALILEFIITFISLIEKQAKNT